VNILNKKIESLTQSNMELEAQLKAKKEADYQEEKEWIEKKYISKLLRTLFEKDGQPHIQQQILSILCNSVNLTINPLQIASATNGDISANKILPGINGQSLGDLWINYLVNKSQQPTDGR
jgi:hypothetical protein